LSKYTTKIRAGFTWWREMKFAAVVDDDEPYGGFAVYQINWWAWVICGEPVGICGGQVCRVFF
jgi:hypothetical protein